MTDPSTIDHLLDIARLGPRLTTRRMFGEYALYLDTKVVAFVCDDQLFIKLDPATTALTAKLPTGPAYPGSKPYGIADELLDDPPALRALLEATAAAMPLPKPKTPKAPKAPKASAAAPATASQAATRTAAKATKQAPAKAPTTAPTKAPTKASTSDASKRRATR